MEWAVIAPLLVNLGALGTVWWQLDTKMEKRLGQMDDRLNTMDDRLHKMDAKMDAKFDTVNQTLMTLTHDVGELKGQVGTSASLKAEAARAG